MSKARGSLGIQNKERRLTGVRENRALSTNLFRKLRELDRKITELDNIIRLRSFGYIYFKNNILISKRDISDICSISKSEWNKLIERRIKLDQKRKEIRIKRKLNGKS